MAEDACYFLLFFSHPRETIVALSLSLYYRILHPTAAIREEERVLRCCVVFLVPPLLRRRSSFLHRPP